MNHRQTHQLRHSLGEIVEKAREYDNKVDRVLLDKVMRWSAERLRLRGIPSDSDGFANPLVIAEKLIEVAKADQDTIITAILYPCLRAYDGKPVDKEGLDAIEGLFANDENPNHGKTIRRMVKHTLRMLAQEQLPLRPGAKQDLETQNREFRLMNLWIGLDPRVILIRSVQRLISLENLSADQGSKHFFETIDTARNVIAPLAYIANYGKVQQLILERCFQLEDPTEYADYRQGLATDGRRRITEDDLLEIKAKNSALYSRLKKEFKKEGQRSISDEDLALLRRDHRGLVVAVRRELAGGKPIKITLEDLEGFKKVLTEFLARNTGICEEDFKIEMRRKSAASSKEKTSKKKQALHQLGDRFGFRVILSEDALKFLKIKEPHIDDVIKRIDPDVFDKAAGETDEERDERIDNRIKAETKIVKLGMADKKIYAALCKQFGRGNRINPEYVDEFARIVREDPNPDNPAKDDRYDNYIDHEKPSGYSSMQDTFCLYHRSGFLIELEGQILDEIRHERNTYGPRSGHIFYKTGTTGRHDIVTKWYKAARDEMEGREPTVRVGTFVHNEYNELFIVEASNGGRATVQDYVQQAFGSSGLEVFMGTRISNDDTFANRPPNRIYRDPRTALENGDRLSMV